MRTNLTDLTALLFVSDAEITAESGTRGLAVLIAQTADRLGPGAEAIAADRMAYEYGAHPELTAGGDLR